ncbi:MAG: ankyrin repeat domain-containing protein [Planctomycetota bacterium]|nr:ankyrin repeat domain-containing protein [Planctomycetota bacterium]
MLGRTDMTHRIRLLTVIATFTFGSMYFMVGCKAQVQEADSKTKEETKVTKVETQINLSPGIRQASSDEMKPLLDAAKLSSADASSSSELKQTNKPEPRLVPDEQRIQEQVVVLEPISLDLGSFSTSEKKTGSVTLKNTGDEPVTIISAKASCGCTTSDFKNNTVLEAGESTNITVTMDGKGKARKLSKTVTFNVAGYPSLKLPVLAESIEYVTLDVDRLVIDEDTGKSTVTLTSIDGEPFKVLSIHPAIAELPTEFASTQQLHINWNKFWDVVTTTKVTIRVDHPLCKEIITSVQMTVDQRQQLNEASRLRREGGEIVTKDPTKPVTGDQLTRYIKSGRGEQVLQFIKQGRGQFDAADPSGVSLLSTAAQAGDSSTVLGLLELGAQVERVDRVNRTPLMYAARSKNPEVIEILIQAGGDIQARDRLGNTPLSWAAGFGTPDVVQALIDEGADANTVDTVLGYTPLLWASGFGDSTSIPILLEAGADVNVNDTAEGRTPLMHAVRTGTPEGVAALIAAGAKVNAIDNAEMTALHIGAESENVTVDKIKLLVEAGVSVEAKDADGLTALDFAKTRTGEHASSVVNYLSSQQ